MPSAPAYTLSDLLDAYTQDYLPLLAPQTQTHRRYFFGWLRTDLGAVPLAQLSEVVLTTWKRQLLTRYKHGSVRTYLGALNTVLNVGVHLRWLERNPLTQVVKPRQSPWRKRFLTEEELPRLLRACEQSRQAALVPVVHIALATGLRKQEILRLRWPLVDLARGLLSIPQTKNGEGKAVHIPQITVEVLQAWQRRRRFDVDLVFPRPDGTRPIYIDVCWTLAVKRAGLQDMVFHDLRHTTGSYLAMSGATAREIAEVLGHKTLALAHRYSHLTLTYTAALVDRMADKFLPAHR